jgi:hypothetical protein
MNLKVGIIGHGSDKFTKTTETLAKQAICRIFRDILIANVTPILVSGHSPVGGIDIWAEEIADDLKLDKEIKTPQQHKWDSIYGYKQRNLDIAISSDIIFIILVDKYPKNYKGMRFSRCYHCHTSDHVKSGACWTGKQAIRNGKKVEWIFIKNE